jgi:HK97 family phage portal protein
MSKFTDLIFGKSQEPARLNTYEGFTGDGAVVMRDHRNTRKAVFPGVGEKSETLGDDPLAIYKPTGAKHVDAAKAMGNFTGWTFAAVNAIASEVAGIQWRLYSINGDKHEEADDHELLDLLEGVNDHMTGIELKYTTMAHLELTGNCYWLLGDVKNDTDKPTSIHLLNPGRVRVKLDKSSYPYKISHYEFTIDGKVMRFEKYQILHIKYPDPGDSFLGIGVPQTIPVWIDSDNYAMEYNRKFFINGASVGLYIETDTNVEGNIDRIKKGVNNNYAGTENAHKIPVLPKGVKLSHTGVNHKDMDFGKLAEATRDRILAAFRVSKTILGTAESDTNRATAETADYVFSKRTIKPKMLLVISYINEFLVPRYGDNIYLTFIDPVPEDKAARTKEMTDSVGQMPVLTQNEARKNFMGLGPIEGGDVLYKPQNMEPSGKTASVEGEDQTPHLAKSITAHGQFTSSIRVRTGSKSTFSASYKMRQALTESFKKALDAHTKATTTKSINEMTKDEYHEYWKMSVDRSEEAATKLEKVFKGINAKQMEEVIANLPEATGTKKSIGKLFDLGHWMKITTDLTLPILASLTRDEAASAFSNIGVNGTDILANENIALSLEEGVAKMARSYNETTIKQLTDTLTETMNRAGGYSLDDLTAAVKGVYDFADERRAKLIAKTESFRASNAANKNAWKVSGVVKTMRWYTFEDGKVCEFCAPLNGKEVSIDDDFFKAGEEIDGANGKTMTLNYGDVGHPPLHPDCRCGIQPGVIESGN